MVDGMRKIQNKITLKYLCWIIFGNRPTFYFLVFCYLCVKMSQKRFFITGVPNKVMRNILIQAEIENVEDIDNIVIIPSNCMLDPYRTNKTPCWVQLFSPSSETFEGSRTLRIAQAVGLPEANGLTLISSDNFYHNVKTRLLTRGKMFFRERPRIMFSILKDAPSFAEMLELSPIRTSAEKRNTSVSFQSQMELVFKFPRYVQAGDILCSSNPEDRTAVYIANRVQGKSIAPGFLVHSDKTKIEQGPDMKGYIPIHPLMVRPMNGRSTMTSANFKEFLIDVCPPWLQDYAACLARFMLPFLPSTDSFTAHEQPAHLLPVILVAGPRGSGKRTLIERAAYGAGLWDIGALHVHHHDLATIRGTGPGGVEKSLSSVLTDISHLSPCVVVVYNVEWLAVGRDGPDEGRGVEAWLKWLSDIKELRKGVVAVVATTRLEKSRLVGPLARTFIGEISLHEPPDLLGRGNLFRWIISAMGVNYAIDLPEELSRQTAGFYYADLIALVSSCLRKKYAQLRNTGQENPEIFLNKSDFEETITSMHAAYSDAIGAPKIPSVKWEDVGGLDEIREEILTTIEFPIKYPELTRSGLKRTGILLYGPPGTGKTLLAKAVATECSFSFLSVKGPELLNMYVGQSEANVREVFQRARSAAPCIVFFDELDSLAPNRGRTGDSGGVMDRVVSQLLAEMDGQQKMENVFIIGATNRPDLVDQALLRPGRFDKLLYVGPYEDRKSQLSVLSALTRKFKLAANVNLEDLVSWLPERLSGADLQALCSGAMMKAIEREVKKAELSANGVDLSGETLQVNLEDFKKSSEEIKPSISDKELYRFKELRLKFEK